MDPATALSVAATGFGVVSKIQQGSAASDAADYQSAQAERAAQIGRVKAQQTDSIMRQNLQSTLANIAAVRASANTDPSSPTGAAIMARQETLGDEQRIQRVQNIQSQVTSDEASAAFYKESASNALLGGFLGAGGELLSAGAGLPGIKGFKMWPGAPGS